jgi:hypothetical protein
MMKIPRNNDELELPMNGTQWFPGRNDLSMDLHETERRTEYTIFIERESSVMFNMAEGGAKEAAQKYWEYGFLWKWLIVVHVQRLSNRRHRFQINGAHPRLDGRMGHLSTGLSRI